MNTRYDLNMDVPPREALRLLYVSKSRFGGDWNSVPHGSSPIDYMLKRRITEAKALLSSTDYSLIQIAEQLGFGSPAYFSKCFRKVEGISPSGYRCALQQKAAKRSK